FTPVGNNGLTRWMKQLEFYSIYSPEMTFPLCDAKSGLFQGELISLSGSHRATTTSHNGDRPLPAKG
ncbi:hypothetical protein, partial [Neomoorella thermoacetica]|uniref:hypothetical protein n=1 Tax=Neomoorella thermoacetica TaxID=1525 RepID=UPI001CA33879